MGSAALASVGNASKPDWHSGDSSSTISTKTNREKKKKQDLRRDKHSNRTKSRIVHRYLKVSDDPTEGGVFPTLFIQESHVAIKLSYVGGVHLQIRTLLDKDISQSLVLGPESSHDHI